MPLPDQPLPAVSPDPGITRQILAHRPELMIVAVEFEAGAVGAPHHHPHVQGILVKDGRFSFTVAGETFEVGPGDCFVVPPDAVHSCKALEAGHLIDTFTPRRDDFL